MRVENPLPRTKSPGLAQLRRFVDLNTAKMSSAGQFATPKYVETPDPGLASWAKFSRPFGTIWETGSHAGSKGHMILLRSMHGLKAIVLFPVCTD